MYVQRITDFAQIETYSADWEERTLGNPFRSLPWLSTWWEAYGESNELYLVVVFDQPPKTEKRTMLGVLPLYRSFSTSKGYVLQLLGTGEVCTDYLGVLCFPEDQEQVTTAVADYLADHHSSEHDHWDLLELDNVESADAGINQLAEKMWEHQCKVDRNAALNCWRLNLPRSWEELEASQSKSHRKQIRRFVRRVLETDRAEMQVCQTKETFDSAYESFVDLHMRRRKSLGQPGCFASPQFAQFLKSAALKLLEQGKCQIHQLLLDGTAIAAEIHFLGGHIAYAYQAGIDPDRLDEQPGSLMQTAVLQQAINSGNLAMDFLRGDEPYKAHWRAVAVECTTIRIVANKTTSQLRNSIWVAGNQMKNLIKGGINLTGMRGSDSSTN